MRSRYDIIVVGGGHAGCEAAAAAANLGSKTLLITMNMGVIGQMSCNPAMGGVAKGQIVREVDALGGYSGIITDQSTLQFRMLNRSKGPAMWSPRAQNDRWEFSQAWRKTLETVPNIDFRQDTVVGLEMDDGRVVGVKTVLGITIPTQALVLTNGTFLNGVIHIGEKSYGGGRVSEASSSGITEQLVSLGFEAGRMKTGTPPRIDGRSLNYEKMQEQPGDSHPEKFSFEDTQPVQDQKSCWLAYTHPGVHEALKKGFNRSPLFNGRIQGAGPRYCPSIEDKISRFAERDRHQLFVEPEGRNTVEMYLNGFSSSLPESVQYEALRKIEGFENVKIFRPGYAVEYDYFPPSQLSLSLETQAVSNLFFAGQINGTTGYEEAACQGLMAGINAHRKINGQPPFILGRSDAYIGVLIDDLVNKGVEEPYRMFTSRAEYRILLRQDNADLRLTELGYQVGLATATRRKAVQKKKAQIDTLTRALHEMRADPATANTYLAERGWSVLREGAPLAQLLRRPEIQIADLPHIYPPAEVLLAPFSKAVWEQVEITEKYVAYIEREQKLAEKIKALDDLQIRAEFDYDLIGSLSAEGREKLKRIRPQNIGQASRISGVSASDLSILSVYLGR